MNKLKVFFAVLLTVVTLSHSKPSQAAVGALVSTPVLIAGLAIGGTGLVGTTIGLFKCGESGSGDAQGWCGAFILILGIPVILLGLVVLEGEQEVQFRELNNAEASKIGITNDELEVYNSEIDQANMLIADVKAELSKIKKPTAKDSSAAWNDVKDLVAPATYAAMQKIVSQK